MLGEYLGAGSGTTKLLLHLNGNSTDSSGNANNGTDTAVTYGLAYGKFGQGASFNGTTSYISMGNVNNFEYNLPFSVFCWIKTSTNGYITIVSKQDSDAASRGWGMFVNNTHNLEVQINNNVASNLIRTFGSKTIDDGSWHLVGFTYNGSGNNGLLGYVDGGIDGVSTGGTLNATIVNGSNNQVGTRATGGIFFNGSIDEVIIENRAWSATDVQKYYTMTKGRFGIL